MSPSYAAPEVIQGQFSRWSDQYSLAATYCELRTGRPPFEGDTAHQLIYAHVHLPPTYRVFPKPSGRSWPAPWRSGPKSAGRRAAPSCSILSAAAPAEKGGVAAGSPATRTLLTASSSGDRGQRRDGLVGATPSAGRNGLGAVPSGGWPDWRAPSWRDS